ncbi:hypothetical protein [Intestinibaculum porci]|jgi:hypothetical protein|nr:hypothetical protein [Intestinibaculum porci]
METQTYLVDQALQISDLHIIRKNKDYTKTDYPLLAALCPKCGHIEFFVDLKDEK